MKLVTKRLIIREFKDSDVDNLIENINNIRVLRYLLIVPHPYLKKEAKWWINHCKKQSKEKLRKSYNFAIELKSEKKLIGGVGLTDFDRFQGTGTIGYWLGEKYHRQGFMTEALNEMIIFCFNKLKLRRIDIAALKENIPSNNLIKKVGFKYEGLRIKKVRPKSTGKVSDELIYGMLKEDWEKK